MTVYSPDNVNTCPGLELVATSRAVEHNDFAIGNTLSQSNLTGSVKYGED